MPSPQFSLRAGLFFGVALGLCPAVFAQLRVVQWNVTNYDGLSSTRDAAFQTALFGVFEGRSAKPDVFIGEEFISASGLTNFVNKVNSAPGSPGDYVGASFVDGPDTDTVLVYRTSRVSLIGAPVVVFVGGATPNPPRNLMRYDLQLVGYSGLGSQLSIYGSHMKAGTTTDDKNRRLLEAQRMRTNAESLGGRPFIVGGDFNIQSSTETSYVELIGSKANNAGRFWDPISTPGNWNNNSSFHFVHTQDPAAGQAGTDDRFDFILLSSSLIDGDGFDYVGNASLPYSTTTWNDPNHSYRCWGNDGSFFNLPIKITNNLMVGSTIAQAINDSCGGQSGHMAVLLDLRVPPKIGAPSSLEFGNTRFNRPVTSTLNVGNVADLAKWTANGIANLKFTMTASAGFTVTNAPQTVSAGNSFSFPVTMNATGYGNQNGTVTISSNDPGVPSFVVSLHGYVWTPITIGPGG